MQKTTKLACIPVMCVKKGFPCILNALITNNNEFSIRTKINVAMEENETSIKKPVKQTLPKSIIVGENWIMQ